MRPMPYRDMTKVLHASHLLKRAWMPALVIALSCTAAARADSPPPGAGADPPAHRRSPEFEQRLTRAVRQPQTATVTTHQLLPVIQLNGRSATPQQSHIPTFVPKALVLRATHAEGLLHYHGAKYDLNLWGVVDHHAGISFRYTIKL